MHKRIVIRGDTIPAAEYGKVREFLSKVSKADQSALLVSEPAAAKNTSAPASQGG